MSKMLSGDDITRYSSSNQEYGSAGPQQTSWNSSKFSNGPVDIGAQSLNHPASHNAQNLANPNSFHRDMMRSSGDGPGEFLSGGQSSSSGFLKSRSTPYLYDTGEPLGSLSASIGQAVKSKLAPSREEMKEKLVTSLCSDSNVGILPGYKSNGFTGGSFHGLRNSRSSTHYGTQEPQRIPSPVARAQAAIGKTRSEVGLAQNILQGNNNKINEIYRHPGGDKWLNASTPGTGCDSDSVRRLKQETYRLDLERQMEQSRLRKAFELKKDREGLEHPLGTGYNSHSIYTLSMAEPKPLVKSNSHTSNYLARDTQAQKPPPGPSFKSESDFKYESNACAADFSAKPPPRAAYKMSTESQAQAQRKYSPVPEAQKQISRNSEQYSNTHAPVRPPLPPQQIQNYGPPNPYYPPPMPPMYPFSYPYPTPAQAQMRFQDFPPPQLPEQMQQYQYYQQSLFAAQTQEPATISPRANSSLDLQLQHERFHGKGQMAAESSMSVNRDQSSLEDDEDVDEAMIRQHIWQTSDQLASDELKKAMFQSVLKKQIFDKKRLIDEKKVKEKEENEKLEQSIEQYRLKMQKQKEEEDLFIKKKQNSNGLPDVEWPTPKKRNPHPIPDWTVPDGTPDPPRAANYDERPIKVNTSREEVKANTKAEEVKVTENDTKSNETKNQNTEDEIPLSNCKSSVDLSPDADPGQVKIDDGRGDAPEIKAPHPGLAEDGTEVKVQDEGHTKKEELLALCRIKDALATELERVTIFLSETKGR